jgi:hypothetical protein
MPELRTIERAAHNNVFVYVERSKEIAKLFAALVTAMGEMEEPRKNRKGQYGEYADLAALRKATRAPLAKNGLAVIQTFHMNDGELVLNTTLAHASGEYLSSQTPIKTSQNPQQTMAYATYMRRMAYSAILALSSEDDDDGEGAADAAASAASQGREVLYQRAEKSIKTANSAEALDDLLKRIDDKVRSGEMDDRAGVDLRKVADARRQALAKRETPK